MEPERTSPWVAVGAWMGAIIFGTIALLMVVKDPPLETEFASVIVSLLLVFIFGGTGALVGGVLTSLSLQKKE